MTGLKSRQQGNSKWTKIIDGVKIPDRIAIETSTVQSGSTTRSMKQNRNVVILMQARLTSL